MNAAQKDVWKKKRGQSLYPRLLGPVSHWQTPLTQKSAEGVGLQEKYSRGACTLKRFRGDLAKPGPSEQFSGKKSKKDKVYKMREGMIVLKNNLRR